MPSGIRLSFIFRLAAVLFALTPAQSGLAQAYLPFVLASGETTDVNVVNPLPLPVTGDVSLSDTANVNVVNPDTAPIYIRYVDEPARQPVQFSGLLVIGAGTLANGVTYFFEVPQDKRLVIEYISAQATDIDPADSVDLQVATTLNGIQVAHYLGLLGPQGRPKLDPNASAYQILTQPVRLYADPGTAVGVLGSRVTRINDVYIGISMSGYFIDAP